MDLEAYRMPGGHRVTLEEDQDQHVVEFDDTGIGRFSRRSLREEEEEEEEEEKKEIVNSKM